ncbi:MAG: 50S ribosomal protein L4 [Deltaproteobacteria bacterium]|nr:50S ribosomal protein L4 [Deltaproteobacteria bacterium]
MEEKEPLTSQVAPVRVPVFSQTRQSVGEIELPASIFAEPLREHLLYEVVKMQLANRRSGTAATKTKGKVRGGGRKPWRQKGTGRARAGSLRSPLWVGGGTIFGPQPRSYSYRLPRRARRTALCSALSLKRQEGHLLVIDRLELPEAKTKRVAELLRQLAVEESVLIVIPEKDERIERAARNLPRVKVLQAEGLNVYDLLHHRYLLLTQKAVDRLAVRLAA